MIEPTRKTLPLILIRGFGGLGVEDEKRNAYQGFNDGSAYPHKKGENYIYEGLILRLLKSYWEYHDASNVVSFDSKPQLQAPPLPPELQHLPAHFFSGHRLAVDPAMALHLLRTVKDPCRTMWVFRYYDLDDRRISEYGKELVRLIEFVRALAVEKGAQTQPKVNIIAHSMGGLIVREAVQQVYAGRDAEEHINKIVTLGTPHRGISFQILDHWLGGAADEIKHFNPDFQANADNPESFENFGKHFDPARLLTVVGTDFRTYNIQVSSWMNRLFSAAGEFGLNYNRSDGLVKQISAQIPGAPRTFVHKCHGGYDSLVTARESFEVATRFFFGNTRARLKLVNARVKRGKDWFGKSEFFFGVSIKPRRVDFDLFHQSAAAENCYGPFSQEDLNDPAPAFGWAGPDRLIWEGYLDTRPILDDPSITTKDLVLRLDCYVGERDLFGVGFSDNVIFRKQYYVRALLQPQLRLYLHAGEEFAQPGFDASTLPQMRAVNGGWEFEVEGTGFEGTLRIELDEVPPDGRPQPLQ